jgi:hypothetical protein
MTRVLQSDADLEDTAEVSPETPAAMWKLVDGSSWEEVSVLGVIS